MENFEFEIGEIVDHVAGGMRSEVLERSRTHMGRELYLVREFEPSWPKNSGYSRFLGHALVASE